MALTKDPNILAKSLLTQLVGLSATLLPPLFGMLGEAGASYLKGKFTPPTDCNSNDKILELLIRRNNIVKVLNPISKTIDVLSNTLPKINTAITVTELTLTATELIIAQSQNAAMAAVPPIIIPGPIVAGLSKAQPTIDNKIKPLLYYTKATLTGLDIVLKIAKSILKPILDMLNGLDFTFQNCAPQIPPTAFTPINPSIINFYNQILQEEQNQDPTKLITAYNTIYNGFDLQAVTGSYSVSSLSPTIPQLKAVGKNAGGIVLIETEWSFTTNPAPLIEQLKIKIDTENLKAY